MNRGLYIHFPFCEKKCFYCDFYSLADMSLKEDYINALVREIKKYEKENIDTVFFGGGTPSLFSPLQLEKVMTAIFDTFNIDENAEITLEGNPMSASEAHKLSYFKSLGVNRLSLGVQSFSDTELKALGRGHTREDALFSIKKAMEAGFDNISIDLMLGIPYQDEKSLKESLSLALPLSHISLYALSIEENTVFGRKEKKGEDLHLPENDRELYLSSCQILEENGFEHYEISNFAKEGKRSRHNMKYWKAEEYIGIGASAHSYYKGERFSCPSSIKAFIEKAQKEDSYANTKKDRLEEFVMLSLRLSDGLDLNKLETKPDISLIKELEKNNLLKLKDNKISLTNEGFYVSNSIIVKIMESLKI